MTIVGDSVQFNVEAAALGADLDEGANAFLAKRGAARAPSRSSKGGSPIARAGSSFDGSRRRRGARAG